MWTDALLAPPSLAVSPTSQVLDHEVVALLVAGRLDDVDDALASTSTGDLWHLADGSVAGLPISSALAQWLLGGPGLLQGSIEGLLALARDTEADTRFAGVTLATIALSNAERLEEAVDLLAVAEGGYEGRPAGLLALQRACRFAELGERNRAVDVLHGLRAALQAHHEPWASDMARVAGAVLLNVTEPDEESWEDLWDELRATPPGAALEERTGRRVQGLTDAADLTVAALTAGTTPGIRTARWPPGLLGLLGAWLRAECWADYGAIRRSRAELAAHALTQHLLPLPPTWTSSGMDHIDLGLARRSGDAALSTWAHRALWDEGPVDELRRAVAEIAEVPWRPDRERATLQVIATAGDLVAADVADAVVERVLAILHDETSRHFAQEHDAAPALAALLAAAGPTSHVRVAQVLAELPLDDLGVRAFAVVPEALDVARLPLGERTRLHAWAVTALASTPSTLVVSVEVLLALARQAEHAEDVHESLFRAFKDAPTLRTALGLLLSADEVEPPVSEYLLRRVEDSDEEPSDLGLDAAALLAVVAARRHELIPALTTFLLRADLDLLAKRMLLGQLSIGPPEVAAAAITPDAAAVLSRQRADVRSHYPSADREMRAELLAALARARRVQAEDLLEDLGPLVGGIAEDRGHAAQITGSASEVLREGHQVALFAALLADREAQVAVRAVTATRRAFPDELPEPVKRALAALTRSEGVARPLAGGHLLASRSMLDPAIRDLLAKHPSALVRAMA